MAEHTPHTPTPWKLGRFGSIAGGPLHEKTNGMTQSQIVSCTTGENMTAEERDANAAFIVRAVNSFEALVQALADLVRAASTDRVSKAHIKAGEAALSLAQPEGK